MVPPGGPEPTLEWVRPAGGMMGALSGRLGSDPHARQLMLAVLRGLRAWLAADTWDGVVDESPYELRATLRSPAEPRLVQQIAERGHLVDAVAAATRLPAERAALEVRAAFASMKQALPRGLVEAIAQELPPEAAELWRSAQ